MSADDTSQGHREQKKRQTRYALVMSALRLFAKKGFDNTTVAEIAEAANCAPRTFFLYFESKEALLPTAMKWASEELQMVLDRREPGVTALEGLQQWTLANLEHHADPEFPVPHPSLVARQKYHLNQLLEPILTAAFAKDLGVPVSAVQARLVAASSLAILSAIDFDHMTHEERVEYINQGITFLTAGMSSLAQGGKNGTTEK